MLGPLWFPIFCAGLVAGLGDENGHLGGLDTGYWTLDTGHWMLAFSEVLTLQMPPEALNDTEWEHCYYNFFEV